MTETLDLGPIIAWVAALSLILSFGTAVWTLVSQGPKRTAERVSALGDRLDRHDQRIQRVEQTVNELPTRGDMHALQIEIVRMSGKVDQMGTAMAGNNKIMERLEVIVGRHEDHLLDGARK
jgi:hypothetical protein